MNTRRLQTASLTVPPSPAVEHDLGDTDETIQLLTRWFREFGETYRVYSPLRRAWTWVTSNPDDVRRVLVTNHANYVKGVGIDRVRLLLGDGLMTSEGAQWRHPRLAMQPAFHRRAVERFAAIVREENETLADDWIRAAREGRHVNVTRAMSRLALRIVLRATFGNDLDALVSDFDDNTFMRLLQDTRRDPQFAYEFRGLRRHVLELLRRRDGTSRGNVDFAQALLESRDADTGEPMREQALLDQVLTLVVAGHETTASTLNWAWWLLTRHPDVETRLHAEHAAAGDLGLATYSDLDRLPVTSRVLDEALRLYPPGWLLTRRSLAEDRLGGYDIPPGTDVFISPYLLHRHPAHWAQPDSFDPAHFEPQHVEVRHAFAYIPFAAGPRHCIGEYFSRYEMMLHLNAAMRRVRLVDPQPRQPALEARINLRTAEEIHMRVEIR